MKLVYKYILYQELRPWAHTHTHTIISFSLKLKIIVILSSSCTYQLRLIWKGRKIDIDLQDEESIAWVQKWATIVQPKGTSTMGSTKFSTLLQPRNNIKHSQKISRTLIRWDKKMAILRGKISKISWVKNLLYEWFIQNQDKTNMTGEMIHCKDKYFILENVRWN